MNDKLPWYEIANIKQLDTPVLVVFPELIQRNIELLIDLIPEKKRLRPHIKTHKCKEVVAMLQSAGIQKFKCATIAEAELLGITFSEDVLLAYQPTDVKLRRFFKLIKRYPQTHFSCLVDTFSMAKLMSDMALTHQINLSVFIDLNVGMNRTGILPTNALDLIIHIKKLPNLTLQGLHLYDGHIHDVDFEIRKEKCNSAFQSVESLIREAEKHGFKNLMVVAGGTPTFLIHAQRNRVECSPGTFVFWDKGYQETIPEQNFDIAALVVTRVVSLPDSRKICLDLGHKSIASENVLNRRVFFLNVPESRVISHSEEHLVLELLENHGYQIGDVLYGIPYHICPTCALYEEVNVVENHQLTGQEWQIIARKRKINI